MLLPYALARIIAFQCWCYIHLCLCLCRRRCCTVRSHFSLPCYLLYLLLSIPLNCSDTGYSRYSHGSIMALYYINSLPFVVCSSSSSWWSGGAALCIDHYCESSRQAKFQNEYATLNKCDVVVNAFISAWYVRICYSNSQTACLICS